MLMKLDSDSTPAMTKVAVVSTISRSDSRSPSISASARWVMRSSVGLARRTATSAVRKSLSSLKAAMCSGLRPLTDLSVETARMTLRLISAWSRSGRPMVRNSSPTVIWLEKSSMNSNCSCFADAIERAVGDLDASAR